MNDEFWLCLTVLMEIHHTVLLTRWLTWVAYILILTNKYSLILIRRYKFLSDCEFFCRSRSTFNFILNFTNFIFHAVYKHIAVIANAIQA